MPTLEQHLKYLHEAECKAIEAGPTERVDVGRLREYEAVKEAIEALWRALSDPDAIAQEVALRAFVVGDHAARAELRALAPELHIGLAVKRGGRNGATKAHGSPQGKAVRHAQLRDCYEKLRAASPSARHVALTDQVGTKFGLSGRTVRKYVTKS